MKTFFPLFAVTLMIVASSANMSFAQGTGNGALATVSDSVEMGAAYTNDIFYSFKNGQVASAPRTNWDIAFRTITFSAAILTNGAAGVNLYAYPKADTSGWNSVDTTGISSWKILFDSDTLWEEGAFNRNQTGHPDYGWGKYNPINHDVVGDSIFIIQLPNGTFKKIWIMRKNSVNNIYYFRYANLDNSGQVDEKIMVNNYSGKNFIYYSLSAGEVVDREPADSTWDIFFTKYMAVQPDKSYYPVAGVLNNFNVAVNKFTGVGPDFSDWTEKRLDTLKSPIGFNWKAFNMDNYTWTVQDSTAFFVKDLPGDIYKLVFTGFTGSTEGKFVFNKSLLSLTNISETPVVDNKIILSPNPVKDRLNILFSKNIDGPVRVDIYNLAGMSVYRKDLSAMGKNLQMTLPSDNLQNGMYIITIRQSGHEFTSKMIVNR